MNRLGCLLIDISFWHASKSTGVCVCFHVCNQVNLGVCVCVCALCLSVHISRWVVCLYASDIMCLCVCVCVFVFVCVFVCVCVCDKIR